MKLLLLLNQRGTNIIKEAIGFDSNECDLIDHA